MRFVTIILFCAFAGCTGSPAPPEENTDAGDDDAGDTEDADAGDDDGGTNANQKKCNGSSTLCERRFDEVAYATTHNAMSNESEDWYGPNQRNDITTQLWDGIRALMLDTYYYNGEAYLCHGSCNFGKKPLTDGLKEISDFLNVNTSEVVTIIFENYIQAEDIEAAFSESGLDDFLFTYDSHESWQTLAEMINSNERLVVFTDSEAGEPPWLHFVWRFAWDTDWDNKAASDFSCEIKRGDIENSLFIFNHFLTNPIASPELADKVNHNPFFIERAEECRKESGSMPNFITVDFYNIGDIFDVVDELNGVD